MQNLYSSKESNKADFWMGTPHCNCGSNRRTCWCFCSQVIWSGSKFTSWRSKKNYSLYALWQNEAADAVSVIDGICSNKSVQSDSQMWGDGIQYYWECCFCDFHGQNCRCKREQSSLVISVLFYWIVSFMYWLKWSTDRQQCPFRVGTNLVHKLKNHNKKWWQWKRLGM